MNEPEQTIMRTSLSRPQQLLGGDREMVIMAGLGRGHDGRERDDLLVLSARNCRFLGGCRCPGEDRQGRSDDAEGLQPTPAIQGFLPRQERGRGFGKTPKRGWR